MKGQWFSDFIARTSHKLIGRLCLAMNWVIDRKDQNKKACAIGTRTLQENYETVERWKRASRKNGTGVRGGFRFFSRDMFNSPAYRALGPSAKETPLVAQNLHRIRFSQKQPILFLSPGGKCCEEYGRTRDSSHRKTVKYIQDACQTSAFGKKRE